MTEKPNITYNEQMLNVEQEAGSVVFTEEIISDYGNAIGHPQDKSGVQGKIEVPIGVLNAFFNRSVQKGANVELEGATVGLNAGRSVEMFEKIFIGDKLNRSAIFKEVYTKTGRSGTMAFEVWEILFKDSSGKLMARATDSMVYRAPGKAGG
jgi:hypothetical protein